MKTKKPLSPESRERHRQATLKRKPWLLAKGKQTGPKTEEGKRNAGKRSLKDGLRSLGFLNLKKLITTIHKTAKEIQALHASSDDQA
jgi:hypothetical protein